MEEGPHETSFHEHFWQQRLIGTKRQIRGGGTQLLRRKANKAGLLLKGTARWGRGTLHGLPFKHPCGAAFWGRRHEKGGRGGGWKMDVFCLAGAAWGDGGTWRKGELWSRYQQLEQDSITS